MEKNMQEMQSFATKNFARTFVAGYLSPRPTITIGAKVETKSGDGLAWQIERNGASRRWDSLKTFQV